MKNLLWLLIFISFLSCQQAERAPVTIHVDNILVDSLGIRLIHFIDGKQHIDTTIARNDNLVLSGLPEDMYLLVVYWPRTFIPYRTFNNRMFNKELGDDYVLSKAFYLDPKTSNSYTFYLDTPLSAEAIETSDSEKLHFKSTDCPSCQIAELYWKNYDEYFARKDEQVDLLKDSVYKLLAANRSEESTALSAAIDSIKREEKVDLPFIQRMESLATDYANSPASAFFVFYALYLERDFEKFQRSFSLLKDEARKNKYYRVLEQQYAKREETMQ